ncbi:MAG: BatA domain-containing protein, partial [Planctomycetaceae bacterium]|nr:BatA domain-containing protein [Planctomycetaceae bacterium]
MSLINPTLLLALPLALIPVVLHLLLRSKPKRMAFPALRLIQSRRKSNSRRFRLKQFWLMLLRVVVIAFFVLLLTRPSLPAANYTPNLYESLMAAGLAIGAIGTCWGLKKMWERKELPRHQIAYRQTLARSAAGITTAVLFLLLVAWPYAHRLRAELTSPRPVVSENIPSAAVFLFDVSLSMEYRSESDTRLDVARDI